MGDRTSKEEDDPMSYAWTAAGRGFLDPEEPGPRHDLHCPVNTHPGPVLDPSNPEEDCNCRHRATDRSPLLALPSRRLTTAQHLDQLVPCATDPFDGAA